MLKPDLVNVESDEVLHEHSMKDQNEISDLARLPSKPTVSVLMITYNHEAYIQQAIQGIVNQVADFPIELVIGEDCSSDATCAKVVEAQRRYPDIIRVICSAQNVGANRNFQRVHSLCRGDYIAVCEGDDFWRDARKLQKQVDFLTHNPSYVLAYHDANIVDEADMPVRASVFYERTHDFLSEELVLGAYVPMFTMCFRNVFRELPEEFFKVVNGDSFLTSLLGNHGHGKYQPDIQPSAYRLHSGGIWSALQDEDKAAKSVVTMFWLSMYYKRLGRADVSKKFAITAMGILNGMTSNPGHFPVAWTAARLFTPQYKSYRRAKNMFTGWVKSLLHRAA